MTVYFLLAVSVSAAISFLLRALPFLLFHGDRKMPEWLARLGSVLPSAIMAVLIVYCLRGAKSDVTHIHKQMNALEDQAMKFLTGENTVDISIVNSMMPKYKEKLETAQRRMEEAKARMEKEKEAARDATQEVADLLSWADTFDEANAETKHMIIARLVERIEINHDYEVEIKFRISVEQYMRIAA